MLNKQETNIIKKERDSKEQEYIKYITCRDDVEEYIYCYGGHYYPVPSIDNVISYVYPVDSIKVDGKVTRLSREGSKYQRVVRTDELPVLSVGESVVITESYGHMYKVIQVIRKEEAIVRDLQTEVLRDILFYSMRETLKVISQPVTTLRKAYDVVYYQFHQDYFTFSLDFEDDVYVIRFKVQDYSGDIQSEGKSTFESNVTMKDFMMQMARLTDELFVE